MSQSSVLRWIQLKSIMWYTGCKCFSWQRMLSYHQPLRFYERKDVELPSAVAVFMKGKMLSYRQPLRFL